MLFRHVKILFFFAFHMYVATIEEVAIKFYVFYFQVNPYIMYHSIFSPWRQPFII